MFDFLARAADAPVVVYFTLSCSLSKVVYLSTLFTRETKFLNEQKDPSKRDLTHHFIDVFFTIQEIQMKKSYDKNFFLK